MSGLRCKAGDRRRAKSPAERFTVWFFFFFWWMNYLDISGQEKILTLCFLQMGWSLGYKLTSWFINLLDNSQEGWSVRIWGANWSKENSWAGPYQVWPCRGHTRKHLFVSSRFTLLRARRIRWLDGFTDSMDKFEQTPGGKAGMLQPVGSQKVRHNRATEQQQTLFCFVFTNWRFAVTLRWASLPTWKGRVAVSVIPNFLLLHPKT